MTERYCQKCGRDTARHKHGECKPCRASYDAKPESVARRRVGHGEHEEEEAGERHQASGAGPIACRLRSADFAQRVEDGAAVLLGK